MARRRTCTVVLTLLALFLSGTVIVLSTVSFYLSIDPTAYITEAEVDTLGAHLNDSRKRPERIPRILHQTWRTETLPERWQAVSLQCREMMPDYEYMLWTDAASREFIERHYSWFLPTFDTYHYPIQRADAIRYFVLHHYGGIYLDLDVGCLKRVDPLLSYALILPRTIPVGVSNDLMFAERGHPFMEQAITNLIAFNHDYVLNYPTVMFSTGPMFVSAQYGIYTTAHPPLPGHAGDVRILPKSLYGKNAAPGEAPNSFFEHHYGSSWHSDDAAFITFLGRWGRILMWCGGAIVAFGVLRSWLLGGRPSDAWRRKSVYPVLLPRSRGGALRLDFSQLAAAMSASTSPTATHAPSPSSSEPTSPGPAWIPVLPFAFATVRPPSPAPRAPSPAPRARSSEQTTAMRAVSWAWSQIVGTGEQRRKRSRSLPRGSSRRVMFFLPAFLAPSTADPEISLDRHSPFSREKHDIENGNNSHPHNVLPAYSDSRPSPPRLPPLQAPPPYDSIGQQWRRTWESWSPDGANKP